MRGLLRNPLSGRGRKADNSAIWTALSSFLLVGLFLGSYSCRGQSFLGATDLWLTTELSISAFAASAIRRGLFLLLIEVSSRFCSGAFFIPLLLCLYGVLLGGEGSFFTTWREILSSHFFLAESCLFLPFLFLNGGERFLQIQSVLSASCRKKERLSWMTILRIFLSAAAAVFVGLAELLMYHILK